MNTKLMNLALMTKWIWRMLTEDDSKLLWLQLLKAKYPVDQFFSTTAVGESPFWHSLHKLKAVSNRERDSFLVAAQIFCSGLTTGLERRPSV
jgi:hypothetical protein